MGEVISVYFCISGCLSTVIASEYIFLPEDKSIRILEIPKRSIKISPSGTPRAIYETKRNKFNYEAAFFALEGELKYETVVD